MVTVIDWSRCPLVEGDPEKLHGAPTIREITITPDAMVDNYNYGLTVTEILDQLAA